MAKSNPVFVKLDNSLALKKVVVESAITSVLLQKDYEGVKLVSKEADELTARFTSLIRNIEKQIETISSLIPQVKVPGREQAAIYKTDSTRYLENSDENIETEYSPEIASLEDELKEIEDKLKAIS